ncbi:MAG: polymorphic toxin-type HINT domain-containing protein [Candidatus Nanoarchaeia archaeon]|nr:polymorphic toxin-type HINT domain-containing protein [Candidatus Nanoarchaeia archaeon]
MNNEKKEVSFNIIVILFLNLFLNLFIINLVSGQELKVTGEHPFYSYDEKDWVKVKDLEIGAKLLDSNNEMIVIKNIERVTSENIKVYNLQVGGVSDYYAGGVLVHNKNEKADQINDLRLKNNQAKSDPNQNDIYNLLDELADKTWDQLTPDEIDFLRGPMLSDEQRLYLIEQQAKKLGVNLNEDQLNDILYRVHPIPIEDIAAKDRLLNQIGVPKELREQLIRKGITGIKLTGELIDSAIDAVESDTDILSPIEKQILNLRLNQDLPFEEIARITGLNNRQRAEQYYSRAMSFLEFERLHSGGMLKLISDNRDLLTDLQFRIIKERHDINPLSFEDIAKNLELEDGKKRTIEDVRRTYRAGLNRIVKNNPACSVQFPLLKGGTIQIKNRLLQSVRDYYNKNYPGNTWIVEFDENYKTPSKVCEDGIYYYLKVTQILKNLQITFVKRVGSSNEVFIVTEYNVDTLPVLSDFDRNYIKMKFQEGKIHVSYIKILYQRDGGFVFYSN